MSIGKEIYFHYGWKFLLADAFPLKDALNKWRDADGHFFYETAYKEKNWEDVTLPHTFNDGDLFRDRIQDAGSGQKRTMAFYRKWFEVPKNRQGQKVLIQFEKVRQTCYLYVNGTLAGYHENGVAPFGFDLTKYIRFGEKNLIAVATDNTTTRNIPFCIAETPNAEDVEPGSYLQPQDEEVPKDREGVGFFWNCNDFNPSVGGLTSPVRLYYKPQVYLTLPLYSNLLTKGCYVYGSDYEIKSGKDKNGMELSGSAKTTVEAEVRNETGKPVVAWTTVDVLRHDGTKAFSFKSEAKEIASWGTEESSLSIVPTDAYKKDENGHYVPAAEDEAAPTRIDSKHVTVLKAQSGREGLRLWSIDDPYLYRVVVRLYTKDCAVGGCVVCDSAKADAADENAGIMCLDEQEIETGFCKIGYDKDQGVMINDAPVWLRGYAQRATNEWAAIGIAPEWLKDEDARLIKESNANHIRWMHVAAAPSEIRAFDRQGIICTQPAGDKEKENFGRQWDQRVELMRDVIIAFRNHPSIVFWEAGNNSIGKEHMREMRLLKEALDPSRGRFMGCRTINTEEVLVESEYVGTMLNRHAARFLAEHGPITETEYSREEAPRRIWDDFTPPDFDYKNKWLGKGGRKQPGGDFYDLTSEDLALANAKGYSEFFNDRIGGASHHDWYSACAALCWTDSAQHGRQAYSENGRMSGRVDAARNKKQSFDVFRVMQSRKPEVKIVGHWNYPPQDKKNYRYEEKAFDGNFWMATGEYGYRDPKHKTVYVIASDPIAKVELYVNDELVGSCDTPQDTFVFAFPNVDITRQGKVMAIAYDYDGKQAAADTIETAGEPAKLELSVKTSPKGLLADGADVAFIDVRVTDTEGRICPLCDARIDFALDGEGIFLGGYNSGRFNGPNKQDNVIHQNFLYAECGYNRVFLRSTKKAGAIRVTAAMEGLAPVSVELNSIPVVLEDEALTYLNVSYPDLGDTIAPNNQDYPAVAAADLAKYVPETEQYCKILWNGQEPDTRGVRTVNKNGSIWGAVICILERMKGELGDVFDYEYDQKKERLTLTSGGHTVIAQTHQTHLLVDGKENLMDGEPYISESRQFVMEVNAIITYIEGVTAYYDDKVNVFRVERRKRKEKEL